MGSPIWRDNLDKNCLYDSIQAHYIAAPEFVGMADPVPRRYGIRRGLADTLSLDIPPPGPPRNRGTTAGRVVGGAAGWIAQIGKPHFLAPMKSAIAVFIGDWGADADIEPLRRAITAAFAAADLAGRTPEQLAGYLDQIDSIANAIRTLQGDKPGRLIAQGFKLGPPPFLLPTASVGEIRTTISRAIIDFFAGRFAEDDPRAPRAPPPRMLLGGPTGAGKAEELGSRLAPQIVFDRDARRRAHRVIVMVPAHRLGKQLAERYRAMAEKAGRGSVTVEVYEGRGDPFDEGEPPRRDYLCEDLPSVKLAIQAAAEISPAVCGSTKKNRKRCRYRDNCAYFQQFDRCGKADILLVAHNFVFTPLPEPLLRNINSVIIEEDFTSHGTGTVGLPLDTFSDALLSKYPVLHTKKNGGQPDIEATAELRQLFAKSTVSSPGYSVGLTHLRRLPRPGSPGRSAHKPASCHGSAGSPTGWPPACRSPRVAPARRHAATTLPCRRSLPACTRWPRLYPTKRRLVR